MSLSYWERRQAQNMFRYMEQAESAARAAAVFYQQAAQYLIKRMDEIYEKYQDKYGLTEQEAARLLEEIPNQATLQELLLKLQESKDNTERDKLRRQLEAPAYRARLDRLKELLEQVDLLMQRIYRQERRTEKSLYETLAQEAYYHGIYNLQQQSGVGFSFACIGEKEVDQLLSSRWSGMNYSERIWKNTEQTAKRVKEELLLHFITGKTHRECAEAIRREFVQDMYKAKRLVRTESNYVATEANFLAYESAGIKRYRYLAVLDLKTSEICRNLDGKLFLVSERKAGVNCPPMHPWCRSTTTAVIDEAWLAEMKRSATDPATGKAVLIPADLTYQDWYNQYVKGKPEAETAEKKEKNRSADRAQWKKYREVLGEDAPETLEKFQEMKYNGADEWKFLQLDYQRRNQLLQHPELKLPNAEHAAAPETKFTKYLFGGVHHRGLAKGNAITSRLGYGIGNWDELQKKILDGALKYPALHKGATEYGERYEQKMVLYGLKDQAANVIVGWISKPDGSVSMTSAYMKEVRKGRGDAT